MRARSNLTGLLSSAIVLSALNVNMVLADEQVGRVEVSHAKSTGLTLYPDRALIRQQFKVIPGPEGTLIVEGMAHDWEDDSLELEYMKGKQGLVPDSLTWQRGGLDRDRLYRRLVGRSVELMGGGLNVPVQGVMLSYDSGMGLVQGSNGRQYLVDWNDPEGIRLAAREQVFLEKDYQARLMARFPELDGTDQLRLSYITPSIRYSSHYRMTLDDEGKARIELTALLNNNTETDYSNADIKLVAGDMGRPNVGYARKMVMMDAAAGALPNQESQRVGELMVTPLPKDKTKLAPFSWQQITLYKDDQLVLDQYYQLDVYGRSYSGRGSELQRPRLNYRFKADRDLPAGEVKILESSQDGTVIISGNAMIPQTTKGDYARLAMGEALAVRVERIRLDNQQREKQLISRWQATVFNDSDEAVTLLTTDRDHSLLKLEDVKGGNLEKTDTIKVKVPAKGKKTFTYTSVYSR
ncbi:DUF4139 domain-containing protein [Endozoicomonas numazuensis]|uniref:Uncharacterized protein n=1 Tax=Endozoicomonas numazuensis TaxID=1137799 RepID=A0A081NH20_9GAMM|nr:DUF4139 domain-containing protein [Endozoicomonas numazuensis]KEQ17743.1 hypothetical protein GZ78_08655 [Endozoicomonas numazuensis]